MRAVAVRKFRAAPEFMEVPPPSVGEGELLVRLDAASINPFDWKVADGMLDGVVPHKFPLVLGVDGAGVVEAVGPGTSRFRPGDAIYGQFSHPPFGVGTYADLTTALDAGSQAKLPAALTPLQAAAMPTAGMTALVALDALGLGKGQRLVIVGASGGIGSFAIPLAVAQGVHVIASTQPSKAAYLRSRGASEIVDRSRGSVADQVRAAHPDGVDALLDLADDAAGLTATAAIVRDGGIVVTPVSSLFGTMPANGRIRFVETSMTPSRSLLERVTNAFLSGAASIPVEAVVPLEKAPQAVAENRAGRSLGKTVIKIR
ncbi:MAG: NADP-dependent oxidoreductase [Thermoplasmata archaeon]|nr:NADP-dependent oxidoreductase [Thermoplasmata archaeon]